MTAGADSGKPGAPVIAVGSGKGGVGKSTVSLNLAAALARRGAAVGLLDADVYGPDIPRMVGITREKPLKSWTLARRNAPIRIEPIERYGIRIMSVGLLIAEQQAFALDSTMLHVVLRQLVRSVSWGDLDYLIVDLPPGTGDLQQILMRELPPAGVLLVVTPQDVAHLDAKKLLDLLTARGVRVLGGVENMGPLRCPHCDEVIEVFPPVADERSIWSTGVPRLLSVPIDAAVGRSAGAGRPLGADGDSMCGDLFTDLADQIADLLAAPQP